MLQISCEHFREQLILKGYASKFIQIDQAEQEKIEEYTAIVMYRCSKADGSRTACQPGESSQIPVYYDVMTWYLITKNFRAAFPEGSEYSDFRTTTDRIRGCGILRRIFYIYGDTGRRDPGRISGKTG